MGVSRILIGAGRPLGARIGHPRCLSHVQYENTVFTLFFKSTRDRTISVENPGNIIFFVCAGRRAAMSRWPDIAARAQCLSNKPVLCSIAVWPTAAKKKDTHRCLEVLNFGKGTF